MPLGYFSCELKRLDGGAGFGLLISWDMFMGVSVVFGWWMLNVGFRAELY